MSAPHPCSACNGYRYTVASIDPGAHREPCVECAGSGNERCHECGEEWATETFVADGNTHLLCGACMDQWMEEMAA